MWQVFVKYSWAYANLYKCINFAGTVAGWWVQLADAAVPTGGVDRNLIILFIADLYSLTRF